MVREGVFWVMIAIRLANALTSACGLVEDQVDAITVGVFMVAFLFWPSMAYNASASCVGVPMAARSVR
jgi:hypothetical protein